MDDAIRPQWHDPATAARRDPVARTVLDWIGAYLAYPDTSVGRPGPVCPYVRRAVSHDALRMAVVHGRVDRADIESITWASLPVFEDLIAGQNPDRAVDASVITMFADLDDHRVLEDAHSNCKSSVVERGHMLGQFYPGCPQGGLWNADFRPLAAPVPMMVLRPMKISDLAFLAGDAAWVRTYLARFAPGLPDRLRTHLADLFVADIDDPSDITALRMHTPADLRPHPRETAPP